MQKIKNPLFKALSANEDETICCMVRMNMRHFRSWPAQKKQKTKARLKSDIREVSHSSLPICFRRSPAGATCLRFAGNLNAAQDIPVQG